MTVRARCATVSELSCCLHLRSAVFGSAVLCSHHSSCIVSLPLPVLLLMPRLMPVCRHLFRSDGTVCVCACMETPVASTGGFYCVWKNQHQPLSCVDSHSIPTSKPQIPLWPISVPLSLLSSLSHQLLSLLSFLFPLDLNLRSFSSNYSLLVRRNILVEEQGRSVPHTGLPNLRSLQQDPS